MSKNGKSKPREPWRIVVAAISVVYIIFMWIRKDIMAIYATMPAEQVLPMIMTTVAVSLLKVAALAAVILVVKWFVGKINK